MGVDLVPISNGDGKFFTYFTNSNEVIDALGSCMGEKL